MQPGVDNIAVRTVEPALPPEIKPDPPRSFPSKRLSTISLKVSESKGFFSASDYNLVLVFFYHCIKIFVFFFP